MGVPSKNDPEEAEMMDVSAGPSQDKAATTGTDLAKVLATMKR